MPSNYLLQVVVKQPWFSHLSGNQLVLVQKRGFALVISNVSLNTQNYLSVPLFCHPVLVNESLRDD